MRKKRNEVGRERLMNGVGRGRRLKIKDEGMEMRVGGMRHGPSDPAL